MIPWIIFVGMQLMRDEWTKYLLSKAELHGMRTRNKNKPTGQPKWAGVMIGKGADGVGAGHLRDLGRSEQSEEQGVLLAAAAEVAAADREVIDLGEDQAVPKESGSRGRGRGRGRSGAATGSKRKGKRTAL